MKPEKLYEMQFNDLPKNHRDSLIKDLRGNRSNKQWKKLCARQLHQQLNFGLDEIPRRKNGSKLGLRRRVNEAVEAGLIEIRPLGIFYL